jgi:hypothetical protein
MAKFRKKPVVIEAHQLERNGRHLDAVELAEWCGGHVTTDTNPDGSEPMHFVYIETLEGRMMATPGDWIIKGVNGEFYPCKPDIFEATYEPAGDV